MTSWTPRARNGTATRQVIAMKTYARAGIGLIVALPARSTVWPGHFAQESGAYQSTRKSGWALGGRLPAPSHDDLPRAIDLLIDLPAGTDQSIDVFLIFRDVRVLANHRLALSRTSRA